MLKCFTPLALLTLMAALPARANMVDQLIASNCLRVVNAEIKASSKPAPDGMADYACDCVVQEIKTGSSINQASASCKSRAVAKFGF
ncbi:hypothetical protein [Cyanobium sp. ATX 6A2]|jgi:hypothetical protein|uniref:hypothetical protein n=1 Tax=Cyanobium sp. ATX 6A2 TaxID=2823700 RepID=UPI0020CF56CE|nr:hypothetical protein [Cyanobium sp. ATX 6A2]